MLYLKSEQEEENILSSSPLIIGDGSQAMKNGSSGNILKIKAKAIGTWVHVHLPG